MVVPSSVQVDHAQHTHAKQIRHEAVDNNVATTRRTTKSEHDGSADSIATPTLALDVVSPSSSAIHGT